MLVLALLDGVRPGGDGPHLVKLNTERRNIQMSVTTSPTSLTDEAGKTLTAACTKYVTFAVLPCSKQSWRSSLSVHIALKGLQIEKKASQEQLNAYLM